MLKKSILILFLSVVSIYVNAQEGWFKQKINDKVTVNFPVESKKINENSYGIRDKDDVVFLVSSVDLLKITNLSLEEFNKNIVLQSWADEFMAGLTPTMPKFAFKTAEIIKLKGQTAYHVTGRDDAAKTTVYMNIVFVDGTAHSVTSLVPDGKSTKNTDLFLTNIFISK
ncbi:hypothetical protein [Pedobacter frigiditerrae]|uniref:hypothetical protein n=1 Tax=Pedobacter frigiditerrae TaxID=2530452 RepID=UPI00292E41C8|nr:hypothetical protein [Pedobacter frigiditerrae]